MTIELRTPVVYVTRDIERALGMNPQGDYFIVSNDTAYGREIRALHPKNVLLVKDPRGLLDTYDLLLLPEVEEMISRLGASLVVFQNTARIERRATERGWKLLNPSAEIARKAEEKLSQISFLESDAALLPPHRICLVGELSYEGKRFVLQFNHSHTGEGTHIIDSADTLEALKRTFPRRECRIVEFIKGPVFTVNAIADSRGVEVGNPSYQITGLPEFTDFPFSTIGNDWSLPLLPHYARAYKETQEIARVVGARLGAAGWRGLFGIDTVFDETAQKTYLLEINARQPASTAFESTLQKESSPHATAIFESHLASLLDMPTLSPSAITSGAQIVKRKMAADSRVDVAALRARGLSVIEYDTDIPNKELFRVQSREGIMKDHTVLNDLGTFIASCIKKAAQKQ